jgi:hypothetical protein
METFRFRRRAQRRGRGREQGVAMLGTLLTVIILGVLVTIVLNSQKSTPPSAGPTTTIPGTTTTTAPSTAASGAQLAAISACQANYSALETAIADYRSLNGSNPAAGAAWATSSANGGPYLQVWPESAPYYQITWNGVELSVVPVRGVPSHGDDGTSSPRTGCFAA